MHDYRIRESNGAGWASGASLPTTCGLVFDGPEYISVCRAFDGREIARTDNIARGGSGSKKDRAQHWIDYWGDDYGNRMDRFFIGVAYLDGIPDPSTGVRTTNPSLIISRGIYKNWQGRALDLREDGLQTRWTFDTAEHSDKWLAMCSHAFRVADLDGDGRDEVLYGSAAIDDNGNELWCTGNGHGDCLSVGKFVKDREGLQIVASFEEPGNFAGQGLGYACQVIDARDGSLIAGHGAGDHGDVGRSIVADIDPASPGLDLINVFEGAENAPYGWALRDAETGAVRFGEYAEEDLGRCMIGKIDPATRGLQVWVKEVYDCRGNRLPLETPGTNMKIYWAGDLSTQVTAGRDYLPGPKCGAVNALTHGTMLMPSGTATNNGTKGNPCLGADIFGDFREELLLRLEDDSASRIYTSTFLTPHKLFTLLHDPQYRCGVAWQNNCYNQPGYPSFYYASDMDFANVLPQLRARPTVYLAADSTVQSYTEAEAPQPGWGQQLWRCLRGANLCRVDTRPGCPFPQERRYHLPDLTIDNCAMAGRSSRSFREEGRLADIEASLRPGDYLVVQFGHNDAYREKAERYVAPEAFGASLQPYLDAARRHGATCIFVSPVATRIFDENGVCHPSFPEYREAMARFARQAGAVWLDLGAATAAAVTATGAEHAKSLYLWHGDKHDDAHLQQAGALRFARAFARLVLQSTDPRLDVLKAAFEEE